VHIPSGATNGSELVVVPNDVALRQRGLDLALDLPPVVDIGVHRRVVSGDCDFLSSVGVENANVCIAANTNVSLLWKHSKDLRGRCRRCADVLAHRHFTGVDTLVPRNMHAFWKHGGRVDVCVCVGGGGGGGGQKIGV
jgi:hypothetical protein